MSERLTDRWTDSAAEAYGISGERGRTAEMLVIGIINSAGISAEDFESDYDKQVAGIDIVSNGLSIDVKGNLYNGHFYIENGTRGWLFNSNKKSDIILHVDPNTSEVVWYSRNIAQQKIRMVTDYGRDTSLVKIDQSNFRKDFMNTSWDDLFAILR